MIKRIKWLSLLIGSLYLLVLSCSQDEVVRPPVATKAYTLLNAFDDSIGQVRLNKFPDALVTVRISLDESITEDNLPVFLRMGSRLEAGTTSLLQLSNIVSGVSETDVTMLDDGSPFRLEDWLQVDGYLAVTPSESDLTTILFSTDVGGNELTNTARTFSIDSVALGGSVGTFSLRKRKNDASIGTVSLVNFVSGNVHPVDLLTGDTSSSSSAQVILTLNPIGPTDSLNQTHIELDNLGFIFPYDSVLMRNSHLVIRRSIMDNTVIGKGNVGN